MSGNDDKAPAAWPSTPGLPDAAAFERAWAQADRIPGWLTRAQARRLWDEAVRLSRGAHVVEIGSHQGRSTLVLAAALRHCGGRLTAVDPFVSGSRYGGAAARAALETHLATAGLDGTVTIVPTRSGEARRTWRDPIDLLWIDGKHDYWTCSDDLRWSEHLPHGGRVLVHDAFSSVGVTCALLLHVLPSRHLSLVGREGSLATLELRRPGPADRLRFVAQLPWWIRNVAVKVLLRFRLDQVALLLGHRGPSDPY